MPEITITQAFLAFAAVLFGETLGIFGGSGFLIQPALLAIGIPPHFAISHDASAAAGSSLTSSYVFNKHKKIDHSFLLWWLPGAIIGPFLGIALLSIITPQLLEKIIIAISLIGAVLMLYKNNLWGLKQSPLPRNWRLLSLINGFALGFWSSFSGLGTGTMSLMLLIFIFGRTIKESIAIKAPMHSVMESVTAIGFLLKGWLVWKLFLPMLAGSLLAGYLKAHIILQLPEKFLKAIFLASVFIIAGIAIIQH